MLNASPSTRAQLARLHAAILELRDRSIVGLMLLAGATALALAKVPVLAALLVVVLAEDALKLGAIHRHAKRLQALIGASELPGDQVKQPAEAKHHPPAAIELVEQVGHCSLPFSSTHPSRS